MVSGNHIGTLSPWILPLGHFSTSTWALVLLVMLGHISFSHTSTAIFSL